MGDSVKKYHVLGAMSGTSLDGLDLLEVVFLFNQNTNSWSYQLKSFATYSYSKKIKEKLLNAHQYKHEDIEKLDREYTQVLADMMNRFIRENQVEKLDFVASHGHTIFHQPQNKYTLQIGNRPELSQLIQQNVICDFRVQDVELGGQGAPLVPIGDKLLFSEYEACLNLGGFANVSFQKKEQRIAYDVCPVNKVLNLYVNQLGYDFDENGRIAEGGKVHQDLLSKLDGLAFYRQKPPKSLGVEWLDKEIFPLVDGYHMNVEDKISTFTQHIINQLSQSLNEMKRIFVTGGGAYNNFLIKELSGKIKGEIILPSKELIEFKEALIFALMGVLYFRNENNILAEVTGASKDHSSGKYFGITK